MGNGVKRNKYVFVLGRMVVISCSIIFIVFGFAMGNGVQRHKYVFVLGRMVVISCSIIFVLGFIVRVAG
jgi:hypothetical protein